MKPLRVFFWCILFACTMSVVSAAASQPAAVFPPPLESYHDDGSSGLWTKLKQRAEAQPFNLVATGIFFLAICHTFLAAKFLALSHHFQDRHDEAKLGGASERKRDRLRFAAVVLHFFGEVEVVFGLWLVPLAAAIVIFFGWDVMVRYMDGDHYTEAIFVFVIMGIASSKPVLSFAEMCLSFVAAAGRRTPAAWWFSILTVGPVLGSFITEAAAMTICAMLLIRRFYIFRPSMALRYATLGLLFVNVSVGGTLTHFAAPPIVMVSEKWNWGFHYMLMNFGWKAIAGILIANTLYFLFFRRELLSMKAAETEESGFDAAPPFVTIVHLLAIVWTVFNAHYPSLMIFGLLFFLAFVIATKRHQDDIDLRSPMLVGFFLAALVVHGGCQQWWIAPLLGGLGKWPLMIGSTLLTAVNDNAAITYLATLVPNFSDAMKQAVVAGAVTGGGLTVIANAPNPAGQSILKSEFGEDGIQPLKLFLAALVPTVIMGAAFMLL